MRCVVVFDTNVLISSLLSLTGSPFRCLALARIGLVESVTCEAILTEFSSKLHIKFGYELTAASAAAEEILRLSRLVALPDSVPVVTVDPDDDKVIACALIGGATHLITGDRKHLLPMGSYEGITITSPADFVTAGAWVAETR